MSSIPNLSDTVYKGAATDNLVAVEANKVTDSEKVINDYKSTQGKGTGIGTKIATKVATAINSIDENDVRKAATFIDIENGGIRTEKAVEAATSAFGKYAGGAFESLSPGLQKGLTKIGITEDKLASGELVNEVALVINGEHQLINQVKNIDDAKSFTEFLSRALGNEKVMSVIDLTEQAETLSRFVTLAIDLGVPELFDEIINKIQSPEGRAVAWARLASDAIISSNLPLLSQALDNVSVRELRAIVADPVKALLSNYVIADRPYSAEYISLTQILTRLEPEWYLKDVEGVKYPNLSVYSSANEAAVKILSRGVEHRSYVSVASRVPRLTAMNVITNFYPFFPT